MDISIDDLRDVTNDFRAYVVAQTKTAACYAEIEGMKAENQHRMNCGNAIAYGDDAFRTVSDTLSGIVAELRVD